MKNNDLNLKALENADNETIERLSESYNCVSDSKKSKLFLKSEKLYKKRIKETDQDDVTRVSGAEVYRRPIWQKVFTAASAAILVVGSFTVLKIMNVKPDIAVIDNNEDCSAETTQEELSPPFGDISGDAVRLMSPAYAPYVLIADDKAETLADAFNSSEWEETDVNTPIPDGESYSVFVYNNAQPFRLTFYGGNTVDYETNGNVKKYKVSAEASDTAFKAANPEDSAELEGNLIWCKSEDITPEGVWKNNEPIPKKIFESPAVPNELKDKEIVDVTPMLEYAYDFNNIEDNARHADNIIIGKVDSISYTPKLGIPYAGISITVSDDVKGKVSAGEKIVIETIGGFISARDKMVDMNFTSNRNDMDGTYLINNGDILRRSSANDMSDEDIDNTYYYEIVDSGELPIVGKEYAFFVMANGDGYLVSGNEYGILYKCDNIYIQRNNKGNNYYELDELKSMLNAPLPTTYYKLYMDPDLFRSELEKKSEKDKTQQNKATGDNAQTNTVKTSAALQKDIVKFLSEQLEIEESKITEAMNKDTQYQVLKTQVEKSVADSILAFMEENDINSIQVEEDTKRYYPQREQRD